MNKIIHDLTAASNDELRAILLTQDGKGKEVKSKALEILLDRRFPRNIKDMPPDCYLDNDS